MPALVASCPRKRAPRATDAVLRNLPSRGEDEEERTKTLCLIRNNSVLLVNRDRPQFCARYALASEISGRLGGRDRPLFEYRLNVCHLIWVDIDRLWRCHAASSHRPYALQCGGHHRSIVFGDPARSPDHPGTARVSTAVLEKGRARQRSIPSTVRQDPRAWRG